MTGNNRLVTELDRLTALHVDGTLQDSGAAIDVVNPATEAVIARVGAASTEDFSLAIEAARNSVDRRIWSGRSREERASVIARMIGILAAEDEVLRETLVREVGCPRNSMAMKVQVDAALNGPREFVEMFRHLPEEEDGGLPINSRITPSGCVVQSIRRYEPVGVVAAISAYNFPLFLSMWKVVPALLAGNSVLLRPSPLAPLTALMIGRAAQAAGVPPGVFQVLPEKGDEGGILLSTDPRVDMVGFTGSTRVGKLVMAQAATTVKRVQLELGGKSAQIFLPDRVHLAAAAAAGVCQTLAGQGCALATRLLVPQESKAQVLAEVRELFRNIRIGDPADPTVQMGPVISSAQRERCERYVALAIENGGRIVTGGKRPANLDTGYFFEPTVIDIADNANPVAQEEIFGPVVTVMGYGTPEEAVGIANDSEFGLSAQIHSGDVRLALDMARRIHAGTVNVNAGVMSAHVSFGGWGASGLGRERGIDGLRVYQNLQVVNFSA